MPTEERPSAEQLPFRSNEHERPGSRLVRWLPEIGERGRTVAEPSRDEN
jgi:hypothetical protein